MTPNFIANTEKGKQMGEYISRKADHDLLRALERFRWRDPETGRGIDTLDYDQVQFGIDKIKACDVQPVRHGRWKRSGPLLECNQCGEIYSQLGGNGGKSWNYCPNCGADMRG